MGRDEADRRLARRLCRTGRIAHDSDVRADGALAGLGPGACGLDRGCRERIPQRPVGEGYGLAYAKLDRPPAEAARALIAALAADGWTVGAWKIQGAEPSLPPKPLTLCEVAATRADPAPRALNYNFQLEPALATAAIRWKDGPPRPVVGDRSQSC